MNVGLVKMEADVVKIGEKKNRVEMKFVNSFITTKTGTSMYA
jgi:hypothetical protein